MGETFATNKARLMLQNSASLELRSSHYYIIPRWISIFRRIFNWHTMNLTGGSFSEAYVLEHPHEPCSKPSVMHPGTTDFKGLDSVLSRLTLDEMVETVMHQMEAVSQGGFLDATINSQQIEDVENEECSSLVETIDATHLEQIQPARQEMKETEAEDKLRSLLKQCNVVQNMIDERLAVGRSSSQGLPKGESLRASPGRGRDEDFLSLLHQFRRVRGKTSSNGFSSPLILVRE
ncbi:hypothetical protein QJS04_geneDACA023934 [Acorus gramineus]|uniref:Uncharacterized protein n=1 Tax=Acorus gramineus TaxID=55184 RepID=A0AAV8ZZE8_ACOGR|nr:hypothetical protein QJS04_geneDACA023934 [Acorus gramineus]